jgi:hypothetical protein
MKKHHGDTEILKRNPSGIGLEQVKKLGVSVVKTRS